VILPFRPPLAGRALAQLVDLVDLYNLKSIAAAHPHDMLSQVERSDCDLDEIFLKIEIAPHWARPRYGRIKGNTASVCFFACAGDRSE
jgi:hypothetical protein